MYDDTQILWLGRSENTTNVRSIQNKPEQRLEINS